MGTRRKLCWQSMRVLYWIVRSFFADLKEARRIDTERGPLYQRYSADEKCIDVWRADRIIQDAEFDLRHCADRYESTYWFAKGANSHYTSK